MTHESLTPKQERFAQTYVETGNATEAYRRHYSTENMSLNAQYVEACRLLKHPKVSLRIKELNEHHAERHNISIDSLTEELEEARSVAEKTESAAAMVSATMGKAKLHGLLIDRGHFTGNVLGGLLDEIDGQSTDIPSAEEEAQRPMVEVEQPLLHQGQGGSES
jgi:phage terminase small subunit